jgi:ribonuclease P protein component
MNRLRFNKSQRLCNKILIGRLYAEGEVVFIHPFRLTHLFVAERQDSSDVQVLLSVGKRHFKHAVDRNRIRRRMREAWRIHLPEIHALPFAEGTLLVSIHYVATKEETYALVREKIKLLLQRLERHYEGFAR